MQWKGKLDVGDVVHLAVHFSEPAHKLLVEHDGSTVLSIDGECLTLSSRDENLQTEVHRKYFCSVVYLGHWGSPCIFCGYKEST